MISEFVEYVKQAWKNKPNVSSPLNADRLNHMEDGIENNSKKIKETVTAVNELTEKIDVPSYAGITKLYDNTADVTDQTIIIERDGWIQGISKTAATSGTPFLRLYINDVVVYEASGIEKNYIYVWSPLLAVKKGYRVKYTLKSETSDGNKQLRLYVK